MSEEACALERDEFLPVFSPCVVQPYRVTLACLNHERNHMRKVETFLLSSTEGCTALNTLLANKNVTVINTTDGMSKDGDVLRVVDYIEALETPAYVPPKS